MSAAVNHFEWPVCVLPGCKNIVTEWGNPCKDCITAFGDSLRRSEQPGLSQDEIVERDEGVQATYVAMFDKLKLVPKKEEPETKPNQLCWICDERRTCTLIAGRWECKTCQHIK